MQLSKLEELFLLPFSALPWATVKLDVGRFAAQIGSWVPAESVRLRAIDAVHTRMGASDDLARGRSTFLEELLETSSILAAATPASLVVIDELGRGTSTHDGLAIAHATMHQLVEKGVPLLFVTHYPKVRAQSSLTVKCS